MTVGQKTPADMEAIIRQEFEGAGQDPDLGVAIGRHESNLDPGAQNMTGGDLRRGGSFGLMQMSLATARDLGFTGPASALRDPALNARLAAKLVKNLSSRYPDQQDVISAYNSGRPLAQAPESTRAVYVPGVLKHLQQARAATETAPEGSGMGRQRMQIDPVYLRGPPGEPPGGAPQAAPTTALAPQSPPDARSALGDPAFVSYLRDRAQQLSQAQGDAAGRQRWADMAGAFERGGAMIGNRPVDRDQIASLNARAQSPVTQLHERQAGESQAIKDVDVAQQMQERGAKASRMRAEDDPNSSLSQRAKMLAIAQKLIPAGYAGPYSASMHQDMLKGASIEQAREHALAQTKMAEAHLAETHQAHQDLKQYRADSLEQRGGLREGQFNERELQQLSKGDQKSRAALAAYEAGKKLIDRINSAGGEVEGMGRFENMVPTMLSPGSWQLNQADAAEFAKSVLLMKGGAITPKAVELQMKALGMTPGSDVETFKHGIQTGMDEISRSMRQREAGFRPSNVAEYKNREGLTSDVVDDTKKGLGAPPKPKAQATKTATRTDPDTGETRTWNGSAWVK